MPTWHSASAGLRAALEPITTAEVLDGCTCEGCTVRRRNRRPQFQHMLADVEAVGMAKQLIEQLSGQPWDVIETCGFVEVTGSNGGHYRIYISHYSENVIYGDRDSTLCAHLVTASECSRVENVLAQLLMIKTNEQRFRALAR